MGVVEDWVNAYNTRDWAGLAACLSPDDFERIGPYVDVIDSSAEYVSFLERVVPTMGDDYRLEIDRVVYVPEEQTAFAQLTEHYAHDGEVRDTPEIIVFGIGTDGKVRRMRLYLQRPGGQAPVGGRAAMGKTS
jgi:SnoaL-like domain